MKSSFHNQIWTLIVFAFGISAFIPTDLYAQVSAEQKTVATAKPKRGYTISKETTYFTGPLKADGTIDFVAAINEHFSQGVTDENNAARIIVPLLDPINWGRGPSEHRTDVLKSLGLDPAQCFDSDAFSEAAYFSSQKDGDQFRGEYLAASDRTWSDDEFPLLAQWLEDNEEPLAKISAATRMPRYYVPFVVHGQSDSLVQILLEHIQATRSLARAYSFRAYNHLDNHRWKEAWDDILTIKRLGRLVAQGPTCIEGLVGLAITGIACNSATQFIATADPKETDWSALQESWQTQPIANVTAELGICERAMFIQMACKLKDGPREELPEFRQLIFGESEIGNDLPNKLLIKTLRDMLSSGEVNLDDALRYANKTYDRAIEITQMPDAHERQLGFDELEKQLVMLPFDEGQSPVLQVFFAKPQEPAHQFSKVILSLVFPSANTVNRCEWRHEASQNVVELALASRSLQSQTGHFPGSLRGLEPFVDETTMIQPSTGATVAFRADDQGILIYHWSSDCKDNGGDIDGDRPTDWGIRIAK